MRIVNKKKFIKSIIIILGVLVAISFMFVNKTLSHNETNYKKLYISSGDTLWNIAKQERENNTYFENKDIRSIVDEIKYTNNLKSSSLAIGQELSIPTI